MRDKRRETFARFVVLATGVGLFLGLWEARLLFFVPSVREFLSVDATYVIWFLAPLLDMAFFAALGVVLGLAATVRGLPSLRRQIILAAVLLGTVGAFIGWSGHFAHAHATDVHIYGRGRDILFPLIRFAVVFALTLLAAKWGRGRLFRWLEPERRWPTRTLCRTLVLISALCAIGLLFYILAPRFSVARVEASGGPPTKSPNVVLITMDTVRADHVSADGYFRETTPDIDRFAARGVVFENAVAAVSWTLPSLASIFTGLLPHQDGADVSRPTNPAWVSLGDVLRRHGYVTAGFNANYFYGESGWGLNDGFQVYDDDRTTVEYNLSRTLLGRTLLQPLYLDARRYDVFFRRNAGALNADVFHWLRRRPSRPYFLYINYFDAHSPYYAPRPYDHRFGTISERLIRREGFVGGFRPARPLSASEQKALIASYDNSLAYLDSQVGKLLQLLQASPDWTNTYVIITADHGEAFGEHGVYHHGNDLHWEEIHVPLIIDGPGIPVGTRVDLPISLPRLFPTILDLALGGRLPMHRYSLARLWQADPSPTAVEPVVSELGASLTQRGASEISLVTPEWHYIRVEGGEEELYRRSSDPQEQNNLSSLPEYHQTLQMLRTHLELAVRNSCEPWLGREYLLALPAHANPLDRKPALSSQRIGAAQAYFHPEIPLSSQQPDLQRQQLLRSLPYH